MGSLGRLEVARNKAKWVYPKMMGANPSERWGHSSCYFHGLLYIFGGCRGGAHFSDVLVCNLSTANWSVLRTSGPGPGPRDSHTSCVVGHRMFVFGGTDGARRAAGLFTLDLLTGEWARSECRGSPPEAREGHTATVVGDRLLIVFGGSGEGEANNYLNDLYILDLARMEWSSPPVEGQLPTARDSHSAVAVGGKVYVFGGDSGDKYRGDVWMFDVDELIWSRLDIGGPSPSPRAGHAAVTIGTKVYILGGVGDKEYFNDVWVLDVIMCSWARLDVTCNKSQGRFSHSATITNMGIAVFGGCGEDERPLNELLVLQIDSPACTAIGYRHNDENEISPNKSENNLTKSIADNEDARSPEVEEIEFVPRKQPPFNSDMLHPKRRRTSNLNIPERTSETERHSHSCSQQSSPSDSYHVQSPIKRHINGSYSPSGVHPMVWQKRPTPSCRELDNALINQKCRNLIGAEVHGRVDGAFDSGFLMTASVNGKVLRGVLFAPGQEFVPRGAMHDQYSINPGSNIDARPSDFKQDLERVEPCELLGESSSRPSADNQALWASRNVSRDNSMELQGVVLTLASPGSSI